jgi:hypothetical protein
MLLLEHSLPSTWPSNREAVQTGYPEKLPRLHPLT